MACKIVKLNMKISLELYLSEDGRTYLNHWDWMHGIDTCAQLKDGKLFVMKFDENGKEIDTPPITIDEFIKIVANK